jgi:hypothetical protein
VKRAIRRVDDVTNVQDIICRKALMQKIVKIVKEGNYRFGDKIEIMIELSNDLCR